jgi:hypothetical protein
MTRLRTMLLAACAVLSGLAGPGITRAQHLGVLVQQVDGQLVTGKADFDHYLFNLGQRVYSREFDSDYAIYLPGFAAMGSGSPYLPAGSQALPGDTSLEWDFLPMTVEDVSRNLFYWDGSDTDGVPGLTPDDVAFGSLPGPGYLVSLWDKSSTKHSVDGTDSLVPGGVIDETDTDGSLHAHRYYTLEDGDGNSGTLPADGIYLFAMQLRMAGLDTSDPIYMVFGTPGSSVEALDDAAVLWVEDNVDLLIPPLLPGDYNDDAVVDAADYTVWRDSLGSTANLAADGDGSGTIDEGDYLVWKEHFGTARELGAGLAAVVAPEPSAMLLALLAIAAGSGLRRNRRRLQRRDRTPPLP